MKTLFIFFTLLLASVIGLSQDYQTVQSGNWDREETWLNGVIPPRDGSGNNFTIIINQDHEVLLDGSFYFKNQIELIVCGTLIVGKDFGQEYEGDSNLEGNALYLEVCCGATLIIHGTLTLKNVGILNINGIFIVDGIFGHQANSGNCIYTEFPECEGSISTPDGEIPPIEEFQFGEEDDCMTGISPILPIELLSFELIASFNSITIEWVTASEINNDYFTIERSQDLIKWDILGTIPGAGNSSFNRYYEFSDDEPTNGISYYRLKQTDFDGNYEYFPPASTEWAMYIPIQYAGENIILDVRDYLGYNIKVYDMLGRSYIEGKINSDEIEIKPMGSPIIISIYNSSEIFNFKVVKISR